MATEIFLQPELEELVTDPSKKDEWRTKVTELGLQGQIELTSNSDKKSASPYTFMNEQMKLVFNVLCSSQSLVEEYAKSAIPIDVLSHIALCRQEGYFQKLEIWYDDKTPDPILVGYLDDSYDSVIHLIARWGDEIVPYEQLVEKAIHRYTEAFKLAALSIKSESENVLSNAEVLVKQFFSGQKGKWDIEPQFHLDLTVHG